MADERTYHATVDLSAGYRFTARFSDLPGAPPLQFDEPPPLGDATAPNAAAVLGAAVGNCLAASFAFCMRKARIEPAGLTADVTTHVIRDERGRHRIGSIDVELTPDLGGPGARTDRCATLFEDFCTVTASIRKGIPVHVTLRTGDVVPRTADAPAAPTPA
jgi:organic hydroperoxide reductase OsmC/OhrA